MQHLARLDDRCADLAALRCYRETLIILKSHLAPRAESGPPLRARLLVLFYPITDIQFGYAVKTAQSPTIEFDVDAMRWNHASWNVSIALLA